MRHLRLSIVALAAALASLASAGTASGAELATVFSQIAIQPGGRIETTSRAVTFSSNAGTIVCQVALAGTLRSGITRVTQTRGTLTSIGSITAASATGCTGGTVTFLAGTLPWSIGGVYGTHGALVEDGKDVALTTAILGINLTARIGLFSCLFRNANLNFTYDYTTRNLTLAANSFEECGGIARGSIAGVWSGLGAAVQIFAFDGCAISAEPQIRPTEEERTGFERRPPVRIECWPFFAVRVNDIRVVGESRGVITIEDTAGAIGRRFNEGNFRYSLIGRREPGRIRPIEEHVVIETNYGDLRTQVIW